MLNTIKSAFRWVRKTDSTLGTDTPGDPQTGTSPINKVLEQLIDNDEGLDSRLTIVESGSGATIAHTDTTGKQGNGEIHLSSAEKSGYDDLDGRVTTLEGSGGGGGGPTFQNRRVLEAVGNFNLAVPSGVTRVKLTVVGGGGGGNGSDTGGGAGGTFIGIFNVSDTDIMHITVGAGGMAGSSGNASSVTIDNHTGSINSPGGIAGYIAGFPTNYGAGGVPVNSLSNAVANSTSVIRGGGGGAATGGSSYFGGGVGPNGVGSYGAGGTGGEAAGGPGADGVVVVEYDSNAVIAHANTTGIQGNGEIHLSSAEKSEYDGLDGRVTALEGAPSSGVMRNRFISTKSPATETYTIPAGITEIEVTIVEEAKTGNSINNLGTGLTANITVSPGEIVSFVNNATPPGMGIQISGHTGSLNGAEGIFSTAQDLSGIVGVVANFSNGDDVSSGNKPGVIFSSTYGANGGGGVLLIRHA